MAFEDFLRSIPLVQKHIMRTRRFMMENQQFRKFIETNGLSPQDVLSEKITTLPLASAPAATSTSGESGIEEHTLQTLIESLRSEQVRSAKLEADLYVLQIDYDNLIQKRNAE